MKKMILFSFLVFMSLCSFPGCGKALDNSGFIPEFVYDGSGEDIGNEEPGETVPDNVPVEIGRAHV